MSVNHATSRPMGSIAHAAQEEMFMMGTATPTETSLSLGDLALHTGAPLRVWAVCQRTDRECNSFNDSAEMRAGLFGKALQKVSVKTLAVHYRLGCPDTMRDQALWMLYRKELDKWAAENKERHVVIYTPTDAVGGHVKMVAQFKFKDSALSQAGAGSGSAETPPEAPPMPIGRQTKRKRSDFVKDQPPLGSTTAPEERKQKTTRASPEVEEIPRFQTQISSTWYVRKRRKTTGSGPVLPISPGAGTTVLVCGDRHWNNKGRIAAVLATLEKTVKIVHGDCTGADTLAGEVAREQGRTVFAEPADWKQHGKAAGPIRNALMLKKYVPCLVIAFHDRISESKGTTNMIQLANKSGVPTVVLNSVSVL